ncbi:MULTISPECIES: TspO/MBR family protein [unclassified Flavobacterium]|uniref:TspO/MBR family protein n=1 Tax=unclassified Flavobacterium TaxID=196869 RepID=UPI001F13C81E|nr:MULTISPECIES: TspO/MBR family protein [unclassified Flavobacterium]UMY65981.1 tryptophan-rich sensory protein [Flavobacterium sp. HJ-32-4]
MRIFRAKITMNRYVKIVLFVATCLAVGFVSGLATREGVTTWYATIEKPSFNPPNWVFAPVWTLLYVMMGVAAGRVWGRSEAEPSEVRRALWFFWIQLALNALWSVLFFVLWNPLLALVELVLLWLMIYETWHKFRALDRVAGWLLVPYLAWVSFAGVLNASVWWLNR